jgi:hypothetical protein
MEVDSIFYEDLIQEVIDSLKTAYPDVVCYTDNKNISEFSSTNYIVFHPVSETIEPSKLSMVKYDGYACDILGVRRITVNARVYFETVRLVETFLQATLAAIWVTTKVINSSVQWVTQSETDENINNQGELAILSFDIDLPILKAIQRIVEPQTITFNLSVNQDPIDGYQVYNVGQKIPPAFNL